MAQRKDEMIPSTPPGDLETIPDYIETGDTAGTEGISHDDVQMPRLALAQALSPQVIEGDPAFIEGLRMGHMFNTLSGENYGRGPLSFIIIRRDPPRWVEFDEERNVVDPNVPATDPRTEWRGPKTPPIATKFYDYVIVLLPLLDTVALSLARTGIGPAKQLNGLIKRPVRNPVTGDIKTVPLYAKQYQVTSDIAKNDKGSFGIFRFAQDGLVRSRELYLGVKALFEEFRNKAIEIDRTTAGVEHPDATSFDTARYEREQE